MVTFAIVGLVPWLALLSFWQVELKTELIVLPFLGLAMQLLPGGIAWLRSEFKSQDNLVKGSYILSNLLCNRGVLGGLTVFILFGEQAFAYAQLIIVFGMPVLVIVGFPLASHYNRAHYNNANDNSSSFLSTFLDKRQLPLAGLLAGGLLNVGGIERPEMLGTVFAGLIHVVAWALLVPVGASIDFREMKKHWRQVLDIIPLRFILSPLILYLLAMLAGLEGTLLLTVVVLAMTPTAINAVVTAKLFGLSVNLATTAFVLTTAVYMIFILPLMLVLTAYVF